jgi:hypothetical protein
MLQLLESTFEGYDPSYYEQAAISYLWLTRQDLATKSSCGQPWYAYAGMHSVSGTQYGGML